MRVVDPMSFVDKLSIDGGVEAFDVDGSVVQIVALLWEEAGGYVLGSHYLFDLMKCFFHSLCELQTLQNQHQTILFG